MGLVAGPPACELGEAPERLGPLLPGASQEARAVLGAQIAGYWLNDGWDMGVAPGPLTGEAARAAIGERIAARFAPEDAELLVSTLQLHAMPYSDAELRPIEAEILAAMEGSEFFWAAGIGCLDGEAWRVEVGLYADATADDIAAVRELLTPYGDKVRLYLDGVLPHPAASGTAAGRLRGFIRVRCVGRRTIVVRTRPAARPVIRRVTVIVRGRRRVLSKRLTVRATKVRVVLRVGDGTRLAHTYRYRRC
jgi:hypothetical protein